MNPIDVIPLLQEINNRNLKRIDEKLKIYECRSIIEAKINLKKGSKK